MALIGISSSAMATPAPSTGTNRVLVLLIQFSDVQAGFTVGALSKRYFGLGTGSVSDFYADVSYDQLSLVGDVYGWYTAGHPEVYYGNSQQGQGGASAYPKNAQHLVEEAVDAAEAAGVDFSLYDNDSDGEVDSLFIVHAGQGYEFHNPPNANLIHSFTGTLSAGGGMAKVYDGVVIDTFSIVPEKSFKGTGVLEEIGVPAHEYGHQLGLPDLYDWDGSSNGVGWFELMSLGAYGGDSLKPERPFQPAAWSKVKLGWITPQLIGGATQGLMSLRPIEQYPDAIKIPANPDVREDYFLLSNTEQIGNDQDLPARGLVIWHADDRIWRQNMDEATGCAEFYPVLALEQADGLFDLEHAVNWGDSVDFFPGPSGTHRSFTGATTPGSRNHSCNLSGVSITSISDPGNTVSLQVNLNQWLTDKTGPELKVNKRDYTQLSGDGDTWKDPGEQWRLSITLSNQGAPATSVTATLGSLVSFVTVNSGSGSFPDIQSGHTAKQNAPFTFTISPSAPRLEQASLPLTVRAGGGYQAVIFILFNIGNPEILYVDDDRGQSTEKYFNYPLSNLSYFYDLWEVEKQGIPGSTVLSSYKTVIWGTGPVTDNPLTAGALTSITGYLISGGRLFLSSPYLLVNPSPEAQSFAHNYLHLSSFTDDRYAISRIRGINDDPISYSSSAFNYKLELLYYPLYNRNVGLTPDTDAHGSIVNDRTHYVTVRYGDTVNPNYEVIFSSFGVENIPRSSLSAFIRRVLNAFNYRSGQPFVTNISPMFGQQKKLNLDLTLDGLNFTPNTTFSFPRGGITVTNTTFTSSKSMKIRVNVAYSAPTGYHGINAQNPGGPAIFSDKYFMVVGPPLPNITPVAVAQPAWQTGTIHDTFYMDGSGSYDPDLDPLTYKWTQTTGPHVTLLPSSTAATVSFNPISTYLGDYVFTFVVSDPWSSAPAKTLTVHVYNTIPIAVAGPDQVAQVSSTVTLDGSGSLDPDGDNLTYQWTQYNGPMVTLNKTNPAKPYFVPAQTGNYVFGLKVYDSFGPGYNEALTEAIVVTTVNDTIPIAVVGPDQVTQVNNTVTLDGSGSYDPDHDPLTYEWTQYNGPMVSLNETNPAKPYFVPAQPGNYVFGLKVYDSFGPGYNEALTEVIVITTNNHPPIANAGPDRNVDFYDTDPVILDGRSSSDQDGNTLGYHWWMESVPTGSTAQLINPNSATPSFNDDVPGYYVISLRVDDGQVMSFKDYVRIYSDPTGIDTDHDGIPDYLDPDDDNDLMPDVFENAHGLNRTNPADGALTVNSLTDPDGDGLVNIHEYFNGTDPQQKDRTVCNINGCFYGDADGDLMVSPPDISTIRNILRGISTTCPMVYPSSCDTLDLSGDGVFDPIDYSLIRDEFSGRAPVGTGFPYRIELLSPTGPTPQVKVGNTLAISVRVWDNPVDTPTPRPGVAVVYRIVQGQGTWLGGDDQVPSSSNVTSLTSVNSSYNESIFSVSRDQLEIFFISERPGGVGQFDIYRAIRTSVNNDFGTPVNVTELNTSQNETSPCISADRLSLYFARYMTGYSYDLFKAVRPAVDQPFAAAQPITELNTTGYEAIPMISDDELTLYYTRWNAPGGAGGFDLFYATRPNKSSTFGTPVPISELNTTYTEISPFVSPDELTIIFQSSRPAAHLGSNLWWATRTLKTNPFGTPTEIPNINTDLNEYHCSLSPDGLTLYFSSTGYGASNADIFKVSRLSTTWDFLTTMPAGRYDITGTIAQTSQQNSAGRAILRLRPDAPGTIKIYIGAYGDPHRYISSISLDQVLQVQAVP